MSNSIGDKWGGLTQRVRQPRLYAITLGKDGKLHKRLIQRERNTWKLHDGFIKDIQTGLFLKKSVEKRTKLDPIKLMDDKKK